MANKIQIKRGKGTTPILNDGEIAVNFDNNNFYIGNNNKNIEFLNKENTIEQIENGLINFNSINKNRLYGFCVYTYEDMTLEQYKSAINKVYELGGNSITLCASVLMNFVTNTPRIIHYDLLKSLIDYSKSKKLEVILRCHTGNTMGNDGENANVWYPSNVSLWFTKFKNEIELPLYQLAIDNNLKYYMISNECSWIQSENEKSYWVDIISTLRAKNSNIKLGMSEGSGAYLNVCTWGLLDFYGLNYYVSISDTGEIKSRNEHNKHFDKWGLISEIIKRSNEGFECWLTECGCQNVEKSICSPEFTQGIWNEIGEKNQYTYYQFIFDMLWNCNSFKGFQLWSTNPEQFQPNNKYTVPLIKKYWR